ncbi:glycosyltransferase [Anaerobacillus alkaliphilus]|uniref:Glycosyltransferase n=1 Tax=Anaerobacillus alkaliphilus TaxID=1548597 RepID=A0A4Q0VXZ5_9BACI|nr:glycosyltransferase family 2 protein [Anaerobacillus alkaliphilus]RXJ04633.1 glycosyltransferase [Anaerobacillus alkaliphilus]
MILAIITCLFWLIVLIDAFLGMRKLESLTNVSEDLGGNTPLVSIIIAAKNEAKDIKKSVQSQLKQTYQNIEWIIVNDRSSDGTGKLIEELVQEDHRVRSIHIHELPSGWLGKNHALYQGYLVSKGDILLFTDGDVYFEKDTVVKSLSYLTKNNIDHLTLTPDMDVKPFWAKAFVTFFLFGFSYFKRPWRANDDQSPVAIGIGAYNMVTKEAYEAVGTHKSISMRPDDDLMLGVSIKKIGRKQRIVRGQSHLQVEWYSSLKEAIIGLEKNTFAGLYYNYFMVIFALSGIFISQVWPYLALFYTEGVTRTLYGISILLLFLVYRETANVMAKGAVRYFLVFPISAVIFMYCIARATILTSFRGGIQWRGTFYSMKELKKKP